MTSLMLFVTLTKVEIQRAIQYPTEVFIRMFDVFFLPLVMLFVWLNITQANDQPQQTQSLIIYYVLSPVFVMLSDAWHGYFVAQEIRDGSFNKYLLKPISVILFDVANNLGEKVVKLPFVLGLMAFSLLMFPQVLSQSLDNLILVPVAVILSFILSFLVQTCIGYIGFWLEEVSSLNEIMYIADVTIGGRAIPAFLFPPLLFSLTSYLPFRYLTAFPIEIVSGSLSVQQIKLGLVVQFCWIGIFGLGALFFARYGLKKYSAYGG